MKLNLLRKYEIIEFPAWRNRPKMTEIRSKPLWVWLIDKWFLWAHEWLYLINKKLFHKLMYPFCVAYDIYIAPWSIGHERIDEQIDE
jgi:hypothetical protein